MDIKIETNFIPLIMAYDDLPKGVQLNRQSFVEKRGWDHSLSSLAIGILSFSSGIAASVVASWIYDKIKRVKDRSDFIIKINEKTIRQIDKNSITEIIEKEIKIS